MEAFIGSIILFAGNFAPVGWALCAGQLLSISSNSALFAILGTTYGGDGRTTFALPDLRSRVPVGQGQGPGLPIVDLGEVGGVPNITLTQANMPAHTHMATATITGSVSPQCFADAGQGDDPSTAYPAVSTASNRIYTDTTQTPDATMGSSPISASATITVGMTGNSLPFNNMNPYLGLNYIICIEGIFPSRN